jgi:hypothetical protein
MKGNPHLVSGVLCVLFLSGCATNSRSVNRIKPLNWERVAENNEAGRIANAATIAAVQGSRIALAASILAPATNSRVLEIPTHSLAIVSLGLDRGLAAAELAGNFLERNQNLLGSPTTNQAVRVSALLSSDAGQQSLAVKREQAMASAEGARTHELRQAEARLVDLGMVKEQETARSAWRRFWAWLVSVFGIGGVVALCIFFPAIIPVLGQAVGWLVSAVPALASWVGVVSVKAYERAISAFQEAKRHAAKSGDVSTLYKLRQTAKENTSPDAKLVRHVKLKAGYVKSETTPETVSELIGKEP